MAFFFFPTKKKENFPFFKEKIFTRKKRKQFPFFFSLNEEPPKLWVKNLIARPAPKKWGKKMVFKNAEGPQKMK